MRAPAAGCRTIGKGGSRMAGSSQKRGEIARRGERVYRAGMRRLPRAMPAVVFGLALSGLAACATPSASVPPLYTPVELRAECERHGGWWRLGDLPGRFCAPHGQL